MVATGKSGIPGEEFVAAKTLVILFDAQDFVCAIDTHYP